jgi:hypothetical protein
MIENENEIIIFKLNMESINCFALLWSRLHSKIDPSEKVSVASPNQLLLRKIDWMIKLTTIIFID